MISYCIGRWTACLLLPCRSRCTLRIWSLPWQLPCGPFAPASMASQQPPQLAPGAVGWSGMQLLAASKVGALPSQRAAVHCMLTDVRVRRSKPRDTYPVIGPSLMP